MAREEKSKEAPVHFELYRLIKNNMDKCNSDVFRYTYVDPEHPVGSGAADLVVYAEINNQPKPFLVIEVKKPTHRSYLLYDEEPMQQIKKYAINLSSLYYALMDDKILRLFTLEGDIGNYKLQLTDEQIVRFLTELRGLAEKKIQKLRFPKAPKFSRAVLEKEVEEMAKTLTDVFQQLGREKGFKVKPEEKKTSQMLKLSFTSLKGVLRLAVKREKTLTKSSAYSSYLHVQLKDLRRTLSAESLYELLVKLKQIQYFQWINPNKAFGSDPFTYRNLKEVSTTEKPEPDKLKSDLTDWFLTISKLVEKQKHE
jgi:hypothetical protein